jgi:cell division septal protein FtsQ
MSQATLLVIGLILQYGIPGAIQIIQIINKPTITDADILALKDIKPPESFFTIKVGP